MSEEELKRIKKAIKEYGGERKILSCIINSCEKHEEEWDTEFQDCFAYILKKQKGENKELKSKLENNAKINVADHKYASEMEDKYLTEHYILNEFEKWLENQLIYTFTEDDMTIGYKKGLSTSLDKLQELKKVINNK